MPARAVFSPTSVRAAPFTDPCSTAEETVATACAVAELRQEQVRRPVHPCTRPPQTLAPRRGQAAASSSASDAALKYGYSKM